MTCRICSHPKRAEIEDKLMSARGTEELDTVIDQVSKEYKLSKIDLKVHMTLHCTVMEDAKDAVSMADKIKMNEADTLRETIKNYLVTLTNTGTKLNDILEDGDDAQTLRMIQKPIVDLYLGCGAEIRGTVEALIKLNAAVNGNESTATNSLRLLVETLDKSR